MGLRLGRCEPNFSGSAFRGYGGVADAPLWWEPWFEPRVQLDPSLEQLAPKPLDPRLTGKSVRIGEHEEWHRGILERLPLCGPSANQQPSRAGALIAVERASVVPLVEILS